MTTVRLTVLLLAVGLLNFAKGEDCLNPNVKHTLYTTTDGLIVTNIAFIAEFSVTCQNGVKDIALYADVNGRVLPAVRSVDNNKYQVSWTEELNKVSSGDYLVKLYDDEGYTALRKAQRTGEDPSTVKPLFSITINHSGTYQGPWVQSELVALIASVLLWYLAYSAKSRLQG